MRQVPFRSFSLAVAAVVFLAASVSAGEMAPQPAATNPSFERLKALAGEWVAASGGEGSDQVVASYRVTASGSAVVETLFPGAPHEMVTVYYLDGKELVLTHYCAMGNQPHMKAVAGGDGGKIVFRFAGGSNIRPAKDTHMHGATITVVGPDHIQTEWDLWKAGKKVETKVFDLKRKTA